MDFKGKGYEASVDWYAVFDTSKGECVANVPRRYRACVYASGKYEEVLGRNDEELASALHGLSGFSEDDIDRVFTRQNSRDIEEKYSNYFSYAVKLGENLWRQSFLFSIRELDSFRNRLREFYVANK